MKIFFSLIVITVLLFSQTINEQIHALEEASPEKRVELMNSIKRQLISMNQEKRMKTIGDLQKKLQVKHTQMGVENSHQSENENGHRDEAKNDLRQEQHEIQEHIINRVHVENSQRHHLSQTHRATEALEERNDDARNNHNGFRR